MENDGILYNDFTGSNVESGASEMV